MHGIAWDCADHVAACMELNGNLMNTDSGSLVRNPYLQQVYIK